MWMSLANTTWVLMGLVAPFMRFIVRHVLLLHAATIGDACGARPLVEVMLARVMIHDVHFLTHLNTLLATALDSPLLVLTLVKLSVQFGSRT